MTALTLIKREDGKLDGFTEKDQRAWRRFIKRVKDLAVGELLDFSIWFPRDPMFHRFHMKMLRAVFEAQEQFDEFDRFRQWVQIGAGYADFYPGPTGRMMAVSRSIRYDKLDEADYRELHEKCKDWLRSGHSLRFLWGHLPDFQQANMMAAILAEYERERDRNQQGASGRAPGAGGGGAFDGGRLGAFPPGADQQRAGVGREGQGQNLSAARGVA
ncbi:MAG TPA: DUF1367 family protein [Burkholderiales bacterium]|nr:DUF1367 family protein [Burkholderiales bacterium]